MLELYPYQVEGVQFLTDHPRAILGDDLGLGKTVQALTASQGDTLVVVPAHLRDPWWEQIEQLGYDNMRFCVVSYHELPEVTQRAGSRKMLPRPRRELKGPWDTVIFDEAHRLKGRTTLWTKAARLIRTERLWILTGTPIPNWAYEIFTLLQLLRPDEAKPGRELGSFWRWAGLWFQVTDGRREHEKVVGGLHPGWTWEEFIRGNQLDRLMLRRETADVGLDLPPMRYQLVEVAPTAAQLKAYKEMVQDYVAHVADQEVVAWSTGSRETRLMQLATGLCAIDPWAGESGKLDMLAEMIPQISGPLLIGCYYRNTTQAVVALVRRLGRTVAYIDGSTSPAADSVTRRRFQAGQLDVLVGSIDKMSEGYTLTAASTVIQVERSWRPLVNSQFVKRIHRIGQTKPCLHIDLVTRRTVERRQLQRLGLKAEEAQSVITAQQMARWALEELSEPGT